MEHWSLKLKRKRKSIKPKKKTETGKSTPNLDTVRLMGVGQIAWRMEDGEIQVDVQASAKNNLTHPLGRDWRQVVRMDRS